MKIINKNIASINHNDPDAEERVQLSIAQEGGKYLIITSNYEDTEYRFTTQTEAKEAINTLWGSSEWDLKYND